MYVNRHKNKQQINTHHDARKSKQSKHVKNAPLFLERQIFVFESKDSACPWGREVTLIRQNDVRENKPFYGQNYEREAIKVRNNPSCVLISGKPRVKSREALSTGEWIGFLYAWFRLVTG